MGRGRFPHDPAGARGGEPAVPPRLGEGDEDKDGCQTLSGRLPPEEERRDVQSRVPW